jgi:hypothetical protein
MDVIKEGTTTIKWITDNGHKVDVEAYHSCNRAVLCVRLDGRRMRIDACHLLSVPHKGIVARLGNIALTQGLYRAIQEMLACAQRAILEDPDVIRERLVKQRRELIDALTPSEHEMRVAREMLSNFDICNPDVKAWMEED